MIFSSSTSSTIPYSRCKKTPGLKIYRSSRQLIKTSDCPVWILYRLLDHVLLLYKIPAKYRLLPMPPSPCCAWSPAPPGADFGSVFITSSVLKPDIPSDCCWDRNWRCCTGEYQHEGRKRAFSVLLARHSGTFFGIPSVYRVSLLPAPAPGHRSSIQ